MNYNTDSVPSSLGCKKCGKIIYGDAPCKCDNTFAPFIVHHSFDSEIIQKLDKIIELLEKIVNGN